MYGGRGSKSGTGSDPVREGRCNFSSLVGYSGNSWRGRSLGDCKDVVAVEEGVW